MLLAIHFYFQFPIKILTSWEDVISRKKNLAFTLGVSFLFSFLLFTNSYSQWMSVENGSSGSVLEIKFKNDNTGWYVTVNNQICKTTNGGINWKSIDITNIQTSTRIYNLLNFGDTLIALSGNDTLLKSTNGGDNWFVFRYSLSEQIFKIYKINANFLYGVAISGIGVKVLVKSTDQGINWSKVYTFSNSEINDYGTLSFINENTGYSTGFNTDSAFSRHTIYKTTNGGLNWDFRSSNNGFPDMFLYFQDENTGFKYATNGTAPGLYRTTDSGINWNYCFYERPKDMAFFSSNTGIVCGNLYNFIKKTTNKGETWFDVEFEPSIFQRQFVMLSCINNVCYIAAVDGGGVYKSVNFGNNWSDISRYQTITSLRSVSFANENTGFAVGSNSAIIQTTDKGQTWFQNQGFLKFPNVYKRELYKIQFTDENTGWLSSDSGIIKTTSGGNNWFYLTSNPPIKFSTAYFINNNTGWTVDFTLNKLYKTTDGGNNFHFQYQNSQGMYKLYFFDDLYGYISFTNILGGDNLARTIDGGQTWNTISTGFTSLFGDEIEFLDRNNNILFGGGGTLKTTNGGDSWNQIYPFGYTAHKFINSKQGIAASGNNFYYTTNGGYNWTQYNAGIDYNIKNIYLGTSGFGISVGADGKILRTTNYGGLVGITNNHENVPIEYELFQNYPNPFNPSTIIKYRLSSAGRVKLIVYDVLGKEVSILVEEKKNPGNYSVEWNAENLNSGVFFYKLHIEGKEKYSITKKMVLLK